MRDKNGGNLFRWLYAKAIFLIAVVVVAQFAGSASATDAKEPGKVSKRSDKSAAVFEDSSFVYGIFAENPTCPIIEKRLAELPLRTTVLLSAEGKDFVLDRSDGAALLSCALRVLQSSSRSVKVLLLQDISFLYRQEESARRIKMMAEFSLTTRLSIVGVVVDVEPYVDERWSCASLPERRQIGNDYLTLLRKLKAVSGPLAVEAVIPWWFLLNDDIPELLPDSILGAVDGVYFMVYGDQGGPLVGGEAEKIFRRLRVDSFPLRHGRTYIALATYESQSPAALEDEIAQVRQHYGLQRDFAGTAIFHAGSEYNAPLVRVLSGVVTDMAGNGLAAAQVECSGVKVEANACGKFTVKGMPGAQATVTVSKPGYEPRSVVVDPAPPGRLRELPPIELSPKKVLNQAPLSSK